MSIVSLAATSIDIVSKFQKATTPSAGISTENSTKNSLGIYQISVEKTPTHAKMTHKHTYCLLAFFGALLTLELASSSTDNEYMKREHSLVRPFQGKIRAHFFRFVVFTYHKLAMIHENA